MHALPPVGYRFGQSHIEKISDIFLIFVTSPKKLRLFGYMVRVDDFTPMIDNKYIVGTDIAYFIKC